jgi:hypothetical protein
MSADLLGLLGAGVVGVTGFFWFRRIAALRVPHNRVAFFSAMGAGVALGIAAFVQGTGIPGGIGAAFAIAAGGTFLGLRLQSTQQAREPNVKVGGPILDFTAPDEHGSPFDLGSLRGNPYLLKFFRGHW